MKNLNYRELVESKQKKIKELIAKGIISPSKILETLFSKELEDYNRESLRKQISLFLYETGLLARAEGTDKVNWEENFEQGTASFNYKGLKKLQSEEDIIKFANIDTSIWKATKQIANRWGDNYQIKVWFDRIEKEEEEKKKWEEAKEDLLKHLKGRKTILKKKKVKETKIGVVPLADFHIGAYIRNLIKTPDFDIDKITDMLDEVADTVNALDYSEVHVALLGDFIESFTGTNHPGTWKELMIKGYGGNIIISAYEILENFLAKITNISKVYMVSGNHDRITASNKEDQKGEVVEVLAHFLNKHTNLEIIYNPIIVSNVIDNICYLFTHGHHNFTKKSIEHIIWKYGKQGYFNLVLQGHWHTRKKKEPVTNMQTVYSDSGDYRGITCPSLFTGNFYSETGGWTSTPGFLIIQNRHNSPAVFDIPLN